MMTENNNWAAVIRERIAVNIEAARNARSRGSGSGVKNALAMVRSHRAHLRNARNLEIAGEVSNG